MRRANGSGPISSLQHDGDVELIIKAEAPKLIEPTPIVPGRRASTLALLNAAEVQDFADQIHVLTKSLAGSDLQREEWRESRGGLRSPGRRKDRVEILTRRTGSAQLSRPL